MGACAGPPPPIALLERRGELFLAPTLYRIRKSHVPPTKEIAKMACLYALLAGLRGVRWLAQPER